MESTNHLQKEYGTQRPFTVPENYFSELSSRVMAQIPLPSSHLAQGAHEASASSEDDFDKAADYFMIDESDMYAYLASEE